MSGLEEHMLASKQAVRAKGKCEQAVAERQQVEQLQLQLRAGCGVPSKAEQRPGDAEATVHSAGMAGDNPATASTSLPTTCSTPLTPPSLIYPAFLHLACPFSRTRHGRLLRSQDRRRCARRHAPPAPRRTHRARPAMQRTRTFARTSRTPLGCSSTTRCVSPCTPSHHTLTVSVPSYPLSVPPCLLTPHRPLHTPPWTPPNLTHTPPMPTAAPRSISV